MPRSLKNPIDDTELLAAHQGGLNLTQLAEKFECSIQSVGRRLTRLGIDYPKTNAKLTGRERDVIEAYLAGKSSKELGQEFGVSDVTIINILKRNCVKRRTQHEAKLQYPFDETFFDVIDTEEKAYYLGFLFADGCNHRDGFALDLTDREPVDGLRAALKSDRPIHERKNASGNPKYTLRLHSKHISDVLSAKGCVPAKTLILEFPKQEQIPNHLIHHFARGYFDGDGCVHVRKNSSNRVVHIIGTEEFVKGMQAHLPCKSFCRQRTGKPVWFLGIYARDDIAAFAAWLYRDATVWLDRKRQKFNEGQ